jgi:hypothetical protein
VLTAVIAIDFGTHATGFAYAMKEQGNLMFEAAVN